jgi:drug/metabolite transporter (DMT)-like permease
MAKHARSYFVEGILIGLAGAICFSTKAIFVKLAYRDTAIEPVALLALRMIFALPFFLVSAFVSSRKPDNIKFTNLQWLSVAALGLLGYYVSSLLDFIGLEYVSAGIERLILFVYPTLVLLFSAMIFRIRIGRYQWLAVGITYVGLTLALFGEIDIKLNFTDHFYLGVVSIFGCAVTYALYIVGSGRLIPMVGASKFNSYAMSFACIAVLLHYFVSGNASLFNFSTSVYGYTIAMALISTVIPSYLISEGIKRIGSDNAAIVASVGPVSTILQAYLFLGEPILGLQIAGTVLILAGVFIISRKK